MAYYDALIAKWPSVQGANTAEKLTNINAGTAAGPRKPAAVADVMNYLRTNNLWLQILGAAEAKTSEGALAAVDYNSDLRTQTIDLDLPIVQAMLDNLVASTLLTTGQKADLIALGNTTQPWWQAAVANGGGELAAPVNQNDLQAAGIS